MSRQLINGMVTIIVLFVAVSIGSSVAWSNNIADPAAGQPHMTRAAFDQAFADAAAAASRSGNTPANREKLRNIGWKYLNVPLASK
jgi:hypothetical protein